MIKKLCKQIFDCLSIKAKVTESDLEAIWQNYIDGTVGRQLYYLYLDLMNEYFKEHKSGLRALSLGCGAGNEEVDLLKNGWEVTGIDSHKRSQEIISARVKNYSGQFHFQLGEFSTIDTTRQYDLVLALFSLPFGKKNELANLLTKISKHLKLSSVMVANFFGAQHSFVEKSTAYAVTLNELTTLFNENNFEISYNLNRKFKQPDFSASKTNWDLIEIIAVKN